jgi:alanine dehydrogenase
MQYFTESDVRRLLPMNVAVEAMRSCFLALAHGEAQNQPRRRLFLKTGAVLHSLAGSFGNYFGTKIYSTHPKFGAHFTFLLYNAETGEPLAQFEANYLGQIRTGAASGLAVDLLAPKDVNVLAVIGSGFQAQSQLDAMRAVRSFKKIRVWSRHPEKSRAFADANGIEAVAKAAQAIQGADVITTATSSKDPVLESAWVNEHAVIAAMGSNQPQRRELPADLIHRAKILVVDHKEQAKLEAGDLIMADVDWTQVVELQAVQDAANGLAIFKSIGLGVEDVAAAAAVYERATLGP